MKAKDLITYILLSIIWGLSFIVLIRVSNTFGWIASVSFRSLIAGGALLLLALFTRRKLNFSMGAWPLIVLGATTVAGQLIGLSYGAPRIGSAMSAIFVASIPLFSMLIGHVWGIEKLSARGLLGLLLGLFGLILLVGFPTVPVTTAFILGCIASVFAAMCAAFGSNYASLHLRGAGAWEVATGSFLFGGIMTLPLLWLVPIPVTPQWVDYGYLLIQGCIFSALAYAMYFGLVSSVGATKAISVEFFVTLVAVLVGTFLLHERLSMAQIFGGAAIVLGCSLILGLVSFSKLKLWYEAMFNP